jgi:hypothetical protein
VIIPSTIILPTNELAIIAMIGMGAGLFFFVRGFRLLARKRLLLNTPTSKIRSASMGLVEISGLATGPYTVPAPITGKACYLYRTTAWQQRESGKHHDWVKVAEETLHVPFFVDDGTGKLLVEPHGAELDLHRDFRQEFGGSLFSTRDQVPMEVSNFLGRHGVTPSRHIRIEECAIKPKNALFIVGTLGENPGITVKPFPFSNQDATRNRQLENRFTQPRPAEPAQQIVRLSDAAAPSSTAEMTQQAKIAAALSKAGIQKPEAWVAAGVPYRSVAVQQTPQLTQVSVNGHNQASKVQDHSDFDLTPPVLLMKGENNPAFLISWRSQQDFVRSLAWKSAAMVWGGGALTLLALYLFLASQIEIL